MTLRWSADDIEAALEQLAIPAGGVTLVHSSIVALGPARGHAPRDVPAVLMDSLRGRVGSAGTIVVPTFTFAFCRGEPFDLSASPSEHMGSFSEHVRLRPDSLRSPHPMQSICAVGPHAELLTEPDTVTAYGVGSSWQRLLETDATVLMLGAPLQTASFVHLSEEKARVPYRYMKTFRGGWRRSSSEPFIEREYQMFVRDLEIDPRLELSILADALGDELRTAHVGAGILQAFSATRLVEVTDALLADDPSALVRLERCERCAGRPWACPHRDERRSAGERP